MPGKLYLILTTLTTILVLLSFWGIPLLLFWCAYDWITILWGGVADSANYSWTLWIILIRPWNMFRGSKFKEFLSDISKVLEFIFFH